MCLGIIVMGSFWLTLRANSEPVNLIITPEVPREGEPVLATFKLNNPSSEPLFTKYWFYADDKLLTQGTTTIAPASYETHQYAYQNSW